MTDAGLPTNDKERHRFPALPPEEIKRRRLVRKMKGRVIGLADAATQTKRQCAVIHHSLAVISSNDGFRSAIKRYAVAGVARDRVHIRRQARSAQLAYGFMRGKPYRSMEQSTRPDNPPEWNKIKALVEQYAWTESQTVLQRFAQWKDQAKSDPPAQVS